MWTNLTEVYDRNYIEVPWNDNITLRVYYNDTLNGDIGLNESDVTYSAAIPGKPALYGNFVEDTIYGWYNLTLNSTDFYSRGVFILSIIAYKLNYELQEIQITINITQIHTSLISNVSMIDVYWNDNFSIEVTFRDIDNNLFLKSSTVSYTVLGIISGNFENKGNGNYSLTLNSSFTNAFSYTLRITATYSNYETQDLFIPLNILPIKTLINGRISEIIAVSYYVGTQHLIPLTIFI